MAADWAPYRTVRWTWLDWYGWSWVSYDPWGWAPYHYGRWYRGNAGWCWYPGGMGGRHYWSPGAGGLGRVWRRWRLRRRSRVRRRLGPRRLGAAGPDRAVLPLVGTRLLRRLSHGGYGDNNVTIVNNVNITNVYRNARVNNGVTAVNAGQLRTRLTGNYTAGGSNEDFRQAAAGAGHVAGGAGQGQPPVSDRDAAK